MDKNYKNLVLGCQNCHKGFVIEPDDFSFYEKIKVPAPTFCPECRYKRRIIWRNVRFLTRGKDSLTGQEIFTCISPESGIPVYELTYWNSDSWDAMDYGKEYNFSETFFNQFRELLHAVPFPAKSMQRCINSDYSNQCDDMKNTYLCFNTTYVEDSAYCLNASHLKNCFDVTSCYDSEACYEDVRVDKSYHTISTIMSDNCVDVYFSKNCVGCNNCFGCVNLRNSSYKIFNEQYTRDEYFKKVESFELHTWEGFYSLREKAEEFWMTFPIKFMLGFRNFNVLGEDIKDSKNAIDCYIIKKSENLKYSQDIPFGGASDSYDYTSWGINASQIYECMVCGENIDKLKFCYNCFPSCQDLDYCIEVRRSKNCFGCVGIKDKQYCILNRQYTKEEYYVLIDKIKKHMSEMPYIDKRGNIYRYGEFFPVEISPFAYNETLLNDQFPSNKIDAEEQGFVWRDQNKREYNTTISANDLPSSIMETDKEITKELIKCLDCGRAYRILFDEFQFLKNSKLPLPRHCSDCRFARRQKFMVPPILTDSRCMCNGDYSFNMKYKNTQKHGLHEGKRCPNKFKTAYNTEKEIIYCDDCYKKEVF
jgi:hypothetical protein